MKELWQSDDGMFKIGITRRLKAWDRVEELVEASVPFLFDIHAMIRTSDAQPLRNDLHNHFDRKQVIPENTPKEFFYVSIEKIKQELKLLKPELGLILSFS